jgi:hypothetical protein
MWFTFVDCAKSKIVIEELAKHDRQESDPGLGFVLGWFEFR